MFISLDDWRRAGKKASDYRGPMLLPDETTPRRAARRRRTGG
jgi:hypothetical protein